jgi:hypothetical protein
MYSVSASDRVSLINYIAVLKTTHCNLKRVVTLLYVHRRGRFVLFDGFIARGPVKYFVHRPVSRKAEFGTAVANPLVERELNTNELTENLVWEEGSAGRSKAEIMPTA